jgi:imidazolonepropionase-like amidohydrolase
VAKEEHHISDMPAEPPRRVVVNGGRVFDGSGNLYPEASLILEDGRIVDIKVDQFVSDSEATVVDARGCTVLPGLIDAHFHLPEPGPRPGGRAEVGIFTRALGLHDALVHGLTTVRILGLSASSEVLALRQAMSEDRILGPRILTCGRPIGSIRPTSKANASACLPSETYPEGPSTPDGHVAAVRRNFGEGADLVKIFLDDAEAAGGSTGTDLRAIIDEAHRHRARVAAHATSIESASLAVALGADSVEHGPSIDSPDLAALMAKSGTPLVPTLEGFRGTEGFEDRQAFVMTASVAGVAVVAGSDRQPGVARGLSLIREIVALVAAGIPEVEALRGATGLAAQTLGIDDVVGRIEVGKQADLVLVKGDPIDNVSLLQDMANIVHVFQSGLIV